MQALRIGIVGLGWAAGAHIAAFQAVRGASVTAICSRRALDPAALEKEYGQPFKVYADYADLLADPEIDVIDICTPHPLHASQAIAAARAGKHLVIEKPIALSWEEARAVGEAIRTAGVRACVCFEVRFSAHFRLIKSVLDNGLLGDLHYGEVDYYHGIGPWYGQFEWNRKREMGGSALLTAGCHALDALLLCLQDDVVEVSAWATKSGSAHFAPYEYPTTSVVLLRFASGKLGKCTTSIDCLQPYYFHTHLLGSAGSLLDNRIYSEKLAGLDRARWSTLETHLVDSGDTKDHPYQPQFQAFVDSLEAGVPMPLTDFETALATHRVCFAADLAAQRGSPVTLAELA